MKDRNKTFSIKKKEEMNETINSKNLEKSTCLLVVEPIILKQKKEYNVKRDKTNHFRLVLV